MVMTAVAAGERPTVTEIARRTALPVSTAHRLITQLDRYGLLVRAEDGTYRVPLRAPARAEGGAELVELAASVLEDLARVVDTSVRLVTRHGTEITSIARCLPGAPASAAARCGATTIPRSPTTVSLTRSPRFVQSPFCAASETSCQRPA